MLTSPSVLFSFAKSRGTCLKYWNQFIEFALRWESKIGNVRFKTIPCNNCCNWLLIWKLKWSKYFRNIWQCPLLRCYQVNLQNVSDENENPLDDHSIVLASFIELFPQQLAQVLGQHGPQLLVDERSLVHLNNKQNFFFNIDKRFW